MPLKLTGSQMQAVVAALADAYSVGKLKMMLTIRLDKDLEGFDGDDRTEKLYNLVQTAKLIGCWKRRAHGNANFSRSKSSLQLTSISAEAKSGLEKIVSYRSHFVHIMSFRDRLGRIETWICAFESPLGGAGS